MCIVSTGVFLPCGQNFTLTAFLPVVSSQRRYEGLATLLILHQPKEAKVDPARTLSVITVTSISNE